jgi:3-hydroxybutyryl-CoA dehydrogenase
VSERQPVEAHEHDPAVTPSVGVVGAGIMGRGIAAVLVLAEARVVLIDDDAGALERSVKIIERDVGREVARRTITAAAAEAAMSRLETASEIAALTEDEDFVIEAIPENLELKKRLFREMEERVGADTILATNTSAKSVTELAAVTARPGHVVGLHFFNPPLRMKLVEIVRGMMTTDETVARAAALCAGAGKETVTVADRPGFVTTRINALIGNEAFNMLMEGVASAEDIDMALKLGLNHPMGPFELVDLVGLDTRLAVLRHLHATLGERFRPSPLLVQTVGAGRLGRKSGAGVYRYEADGGRADD